MLTWHHSSKVSMLGSRAAVGRAWVAVGVDGCAGVRALFSVDRRWNLQRGMAWVCECVCV